MANLGRKGDLFVVRFRFRKKEYKRSLKVRDRAEAQAARRKVEIAIHRLHTGQTQVPDGIDPGDFIVSGGTLTRLVPDPIRTYAIREEIDNYLKAVKTYLAPSTHALFTIHLNHWRKYLGRRTCRSLTSVAHEDLNSSTHERQ